MIETFRVLKILLLIAFALLIAAKRFRISYSVTLVSTGFIISILQFHLHFALSFQIIMFVFLPALIFREALTMDIRQVKAHIVPILLLVLVGIIGQVLVLGYVLHLFFGYELYHALLFSVIIIPTDPVGVVNILKETGAADERIKIIAEGESLFDDAVAIILFGTFMSIILKEETLNPHFFITFFSREIILSFLLGSLIGVLAYVLIKLSDDIHGQVIISLVTAFGGFLLAASLHSSGILLIVFAGLVLGNMQHLTRFSNVVNRNHLFFWDILTFLITALLYLIIGIVIQNTHGFSDYIRLLPRTVLIFAIMFVLRWLMLVIILKTVGILQKKPFLLKTITFMAIGSMKGPISLAMLIALPVAIGMDYLVQACIIGYSIILFSIVIQGSLLKLFATRLLDTGTYSSRGR